jgi:hypothetical protein
LETHKERGEKRVKASSEISQLLPPKNTAINASEKYMSNGFEQSGKSTKKKLGLATLTILIFYEVCGGPFGLEVFFTTLIRTYPNEFTAFEGHRSCRGPVLCTSRFFANFGLVRS